MDEDFFGQWLEHKLTYRIRSVGEGGKTQVYCPACGAAAAERVAASIRPETKQTAADPSTDTIATLQARIKELEAAIAKQEAAEIETRDRLYAKWSAAEAQLAAVTAERDAAREALGVIGDRKGVGEGKGG